MPIFDHGVSSRERPGLPDSIEALEDHLPKFDVNEVHQLEIDLPAETALDTVLGLTVTPDWLVRTLFRIRGLSGLDLTIEQFCVEELGLEVVARTSTIAIAAGRLRSGQRVAIGFEGVPIGEDRSRLITETRVADVNLAFRIYWAGVGPFSALIRRRWLRAVARRAHT